MISRQVVTVVAAQTKKTMTKREEMGETMAITVFAIRSTNRITKYMIPSRKSMRVTPAFGSELSARGWSSVFQQTVPNTRTSYASPTTHKLTTSGLDEKEQSPTRGSKMRTGIIFPTTQLVKPKFKSCAPAKKIMDQTLSRCECGRVIQIRRRTRKLEMAMESQPAYAPNEIHALHTTSDIVIIESPLRKIVSMVKKLGTMYRKIKNKTFATEVGALHMYSTSSSSVIR
ncbi:hypothetical protein K438DRAFT_1808258 [Mycena galopus ATCC 62051]|nr:hypothetical protein K438DRAFT_1808258 [Mycena galopus ATCC 62051]